MISKTTSELEADLGSQVRRARMSRGLRIQDLAEQASISRSALSKLEAGRGSTLSTLIRVVKALGLVDWLATLAPDPGVSPMQQLQASSRAERQRVRLPRGITAGGNR